MLTFDVFAGEELRAEALDERPMDLVLDALRVSHRDRGVVELQAE